MTSITKLAEGGFNRVFLLPTEDKFEAIAKIPYHITVPKRYGYSATAENPAGVEYLIMEKAEGIRIEEKWLTMSKRERLKLASSFVEIERKFFDIPFGAIGSIYFTSDVPAHLRAPLYSEGHKEDDFA